MKQLAQVFLSLKEEDLAVLKAVEGGMRKREWVPVDEIAASSILSLDKAEYRLHQLSAMSLVEKTSVPYEGFRIGFDAYDLLALSDLVRKNIVLSLGDRTGVGKESVVYEALGEVPAVIKFHRQGRTSFKHVRRTRDHLKDRHRMAWIHAARLSARAEYSVLKRLYPEVAVPRPLGLSRHAVVMEHISGAVLSGVALECPEDTLDAILNEVGKAHRLGLIHADLSEFNVIMGEDSLGIIDWPQAVKTSHPEASFFLERDVSNVLRFFKRKYGIDISLQDAYSMSGIAGRAVAGSDGDGD